MLAFGLTLAALVSGGVWQAGAQTPAPQQETPPTTSLLDSLLGALFPTTTTTLAPLTTEPAVGPPSTSSGGPVPTTAPRPAGDGAGVAADRTIPPEAQAIINSVLRTGSNNNLKLLEALRRLTDLGMTAEEAAIVGMGQFPVAGEAYWSDDWYDARFTPAFHFHQGTDIFAARGTPVRAPADGVVQFGEEGAGGKAAYVTTADGTYYYMAHLDSFSREFKSGAKVKQGQVVGFVGDTGNAVGGSPHVHFEVHPKGGGAVNPKPIIDKWVTDAIAAVPTAVAPFQPQHLPRPFTAAGLLRRMDIGSLGAPVSSEGPQLWARSVRRGAGGIRLADVASGAEEAPWDPRVRGEAAREAELRRAEELARHILSPLTPRVLDGLGVRD